MCFLFKLRDGSTECGFEPRTMGFERVKKRVKENIDVKENFPSSLLRFTGIN